MSCEELENIYEEMNNRNRPINLYDIKYDTTLDNSIERCYAIYGLGNWHLQPSWLRLNKYIREIITEDVGCFYSVHPILNEGILHQTLLLNLLCYGGIHHLQLFHVSCSSLKISNYLHQIKLPLV